VIPVAHIENNSRRRLNHYPPALNEKLQFKMAWRDSLASPHQDTYHRGDSIIGIDELFECGGWAIAQGDL
jgi:hypothetical protein